MRASCSTVFKYIYDAELSHYPMQPMGVLLRNYSREKTLVVGKITVPMKYENLEHVLDVIINCSRRQSPWTVWARLVE